MTLIPIDQIQADGATRVRARTSERACQEYADAMEAGARFPPLVVFHDGERHWLADGFHRLEAYRARAVTEVPCELHDGSLRDALLFAVGANATHGLPRTIEDKRRAVLLMLEDDVWGVRSDRWIAERCAVSHPFVRKLRALLAPAEDDALPPIEPEDLIPDVEEAEPTANGGADHVDGSTGNVSSWNLPPGLPDEVPDEKQDRDSAKPARQVHSPARKRLGRDGKLRTTSSRSSSRTREANVEGRENADSTRARPAATPPDLLAAIREATESFFANASQEQLERFKALSPAAQLVVLSTVLAGASLDEALVTDETLRREADPDADVPLSVEGAPSVRPAALPTVDVAGRVVPKRVRAALAEHPRIKALVNDLRRVRSRWKALLDEYMRNGRTDMGPVMYESGHLEQDWKRLEYAFASSLVPYAVCGYCKGEEADCPACQGSGWLTKRKHENVPEQVRSSPLGAGAMGWWIDRERNKEADR